MAMTPRREHVRQSPATRNQGTITPETRRPVKSMNHVERFRAVMNFQPVDRLPRVGMGHVVGRDHRPLEDGGPAGRAGDGVRHRPVLRPRSLPAVLVLARPIRRSRRCSTTSRGSSRTWTTTCGSGRGCFPTTRAAIESMRPWAARQARGEAVVWITLEGFFWFPRTLMGFTKISLAFYDQPELIHRDQPGPDRLQSEDPRPGGASLRADVRHDRRGHVVQPRADDLRAAFRRVHRAVLPADRAAAAGDGRRDPRRHRRRRDPAGALAAARGDPRRAAAGAAGGRGRHGAAPAVSRRCAWSATSTRWS